MEGKGCWRLGSWLRAVAYLVGGERAPPAPWKSRGRGQGVSHVLLMARQVGEGPVWGLQAWVERERERMQAYPFRS